MGQEIYPTLPGRTWDTTATPVFNTKVLKSVNLTESRVSFTASPIYRMTLKYDVLREGLFNGNSYDEWTELFSFFLARRGRWDSFLYLNPDDYQVVDQPFGNAPNGSNTDFHLARTLGSFTERVANVETIDEVAVDGATVGYTVSNQGVVTFDTAPAEGSELTWSGSYYYRCRFTEDESDFQQFMLRLWSARSVLFDACLGVKIL